MGEYPQYFDTSYKVAADFENLLRMIFVGRIKTHYIWKDFVTMRTGGASSSGMASHKQIERDHKRALKEHGVYSNFLLVGLRYLYKIGELVMAKLSWMVMAQKDINIGNSAPENLLDFVTILQEELIAAHVLPTGRKTLIVGGYLGSKFTFFDVIYS